MTRDEIVTGERLQSLAGISLIPHHVRDFHQGVHRHARETVVFERHDDLVSAEIERVAGHTTIFVYSHELDGFLEHVWPHLDRGPYVLITHNSDFGVDESRVPVADDPKLTRWFAQNLEVRHPKLAPLPIGIANAMWPHGHLRQLHREIRRAAKRDKDQSVFLHFNPATHAPRRVIWETLRANFPDMPAQPPKARGFKGYLRSLGRHRYCVCPRGNGADTHRLWECLYLGVTPIVERSTHTELWMERGVPLLVVDDWAQLTPELLRDREHARFSPDDIPLLQMSHHRAGVQEAAAASA